MDWGWKGEGNVPLSSYWLKVFFWRSKRFPMGRSDPGDQNMLKTQISWNFLKMDSWCRSSPHEPNTTWTSSNRHRMWEISYFVHFSKQEKKCSLYSPYSLIGKIVLLMWHGTIITHGRCWVSNDYVVGKLASGYVDQLMANMCHSAVEWEGATWHLVISLWCKICWSPRGSNLRPPTWNILFMDQATNPPMYWILTLYQ